MRGSRPVRGAPGGSCGGCATVSSCRPRGFARTFRGIVAVDGVDLSVRRGTIHALIGPNGAGKTTCFNLLTKFLTPTRGPHHLQRRATSPAVRPPMWRGWGLVRSFQISAVFPQLTVLENVRIALQRQRGDSFDFWRSDDACCEPSTRGPRTLLDEVGLAELRGPAARRPLLRAQAGAGTRHHARARPGADAARRADGRHGASRTSSASPR